MRVRAKNERGEPLIAQIVERVRASNPDIRPHGEDDWSWTWADEGFDMLESGDVLLAERKFEELIVAEPDEPDGYEGLALVYRHMGRKREARVLIEHAVHLATDLLARDYIEPHVLEELQAEQQLIDAMEDIAQD